MVQESIDNIYNTKYEETNWELKYKMVSKVESLRLASVGHQDT
jgi:hypothetical protein